MRTQNLFKSLFMAIMAFAIVGGTNDEPIPPQDDPKDDPIEEEKEPTASIEIAEITTNSISFTIEATDAKSITYLITEGTVAADADTALAEGGKYHVTFDLVDDAGNKITGEWTGNGYAINLTAQSSSLAAKPLTIRK